MVISQTAHRIQRLNFTSFGGEEEVLSGEQKMLAELALKAVAEPTPPPPPPAPTFSEQEMQAANAAGYTKGYDTGMSEEKAKRTTEDAAHEASTLLVLETIANRITLAGESHNTFLKQQEATLGKLTLAIARKVAGEALKREPYANVEALLRECSNMVIGEAKITVTVSPTMAQGLRHRIDGLRPLLQGFEGAITMEEDASLAEHDCRVEWKNGYAERNAAALWSNLEALIAKTSLNS